MYIAVLRPEDSRTPGRGQHTLAPEQISKLCTHIKKYTCKNERNENIDIRHPLPQPKQGIHDY